MSAFRFGPMETSSMMKKAAVTCPPTLPTSPVILFSSEAVAFHAVISEPPSVPLDLERNIFCLAISTKSKGTLPVFGGVLTEAAIDCPWLNLARTTRAFKSVRCGLFTGVQDFTELTVLDYSRSGPRIRFDTLQELNHRSDPFIKQP
jgi:hypothetical protein